ncbi:hypothetical protein CMUS01_04123 [Colletotrichum musicola]|uniref:Uncharacterized protein n=1 Tax=Colletotrichum musicola TaxID=2175873 RepID=A0A8H6U0K6_9PEZI|nr:hypothetical protein CMUS01_04123 [Colletotrichum musicola]
MQPAQVLGAATSHPTGNRFKVFLSGKNHWQSHRSRPPSRHMFPPFVFPLAARLGCRVAAAAAAAAAAATDVNLTRQL